MPSFNPWLGNASPFQTQLQSQQHLRTKFQQRRHAQNMLADDIAGIAHGVGGLGGLLAYKGAQIIKDQLGNYYRVYTLTKTKTKRKRKQKTKKRCCKMIKGKKVCKPEFCPKKRKYYRRKKYWY